MLLVSARWFHSDEEEEEYLLGSTEERGRQMTRMISSAEEGRQSQFRISRSMNIVAEFPVVKVIYIYKRKGSLFRV